jgi:XRE family aerobic/anaerobic benzoate catabolism transcriptional regulator
MNAMATTTKQARPPVKPSRPGGDVRQYLTRLGERVRRLRHQRAMTRKTLAQHADVSERYLAQLESGEGNCSIVLLRRIAGAMNVPVTQLVTEGADPSVDAVLLSQFLERLPAQAAKEARELVLKHFGDTYGAGRRSRIALIGLRGGGKSTIGAALAERLGYPFIELDREVERFAGTSLGKIFEMFGQDTFRRAERDALDEILRRYPEFVLATSGSIVTEPATYEQLLSSCLTVWVRAEPSEHMNRVIAQGDMRPMASNPRAMDDLIAILQSRETLYAKADLTLDTTGKTPNQSLSDILAYIGDPA